MMKTNIDGYLSKLLVLFEIAYFYVTGLILSC